MKILFLLPYPLNTAPSQRFRVEMLLPILGENNIDYTLRPFISNETFNVLYKEGSLIKKAKGIFKSYFKRMVTVLFEAKKYDYIFIHREAAPLGPPVFEWYLARILKKSIVYDFDDAIWIPNTSAQNRLVGLFKASWKVRFICRWSKSIAAGNDYLCAFARNNSIANVIKMPTVVDTLHRYNLLHKPHSGKITIGWTGSHSTLKYLEIIVPVIQKLQQEFDFIFLVIADKQPTLPINNLRYLPWNSATEIKDLIGIDIGIMPLKYDLWAEGKCGFKLIQYLALGIPSVADAVGANKEIIEHDFNGYLCSGPDEWYRYLKKLIEQPGLREALGKNGRAKIVESYSIASNTDVFLSLFK
ncbi:MAG: glycosyltransferase family 4 protein [Mucilaginibacter sp.]